MYYEFTGDATDTSGNGNNGTAYNSPTYTSNAMVFNGTTQYVQSSTTAVRTDDSFTMGASVYLSNVTGNHTIMSTPGTSATSFALRSSGATWQFVATNTDVAAPTTTIATSTTAAVASTWVTIVGVYDDANDEMRLYVNGTLEDTASKSLDWHVSGGVLVGRNQVNAAATDYMSGRLDNVRTWNHPLTTADLTQGLTSNMTSHFAFDEASGSTAADSSGNGFTATCTGGCALGATGRDGGGVTMNGTTGYMTSPAIVDTTNSYTVSAWVKLSSISTGNHSFLGQEGTNMSAFQLQHQNYGGTQNNWAFQVEGANDGSQEQMTETPTTNIAVAGQWTHLTGVYDDPNNLIKLYVNGVLVDTTTQSFDFAATSSFTVGAIKYSGTRSDYFPGVIDDVRTFSRVLTDNEIANLAYRSPAMYWKLDAGAGSSLLDSSAHGKTGTATSTSWTTGYRGNALSFNGTSSVATTTNSVATNASFSVTAWVYASATGARTAVSEDGTSYSGFQLGIDNTTSKWMFRMRTADASTTVLTALGSAVATGVWTHLTGTYDDANDLMYLYVNGALVGSAANTTDWSATGSTVVGRAKSAGSAAEYFSGYIDEVQTLPFVLDASELPDLMGATNPTSTPDTLHLPNVAVGRVGALQGVQQGLQASVATAFAGYSSAYNNTGFATPNTFSIECWFRASGTSGGDIVGYSNLKTAMTGDTADRLVYLDSGGKVTFGVAPAGVMSTVQSTLAYNDAAWHHVVATLGAGGMVLYIDGAAVDSKPSITTGRTVATGYWRWGGTNLTGWLNEPTSDYFVGSIDEVAYYNTQLTANQVARHYAANH
jgi:hypothetical protein